MKFLLSLLILFPAVAIQAQVLDNFYIEFGLARYAIIPGLFEAQGYSAEFATLTGANVGYQLSNVWQLEAGIRYGRGDIYSGSGLSLEQTSVHSRELNLGATYTLYPTKRLYFSFAANALFEHAKVRGSYSVDHPSPTHINHKRLFLGAGLSPEINFRIAPRFEVFANTRLRFGITTIKSQATRAEPQVYIDELTFSNSFLEPLNALGLRVRL